PCECNELLGRIYIETKKLTNAEECFLEALRIEPQRADIIAAYGYLMLKAGQKNKARQLIEEALKIDPENAVVLHYNFFYHLIVNKKDKQIAALGEYIKASGNEERKLFKAGIMEYCNGNFKAAYESLRQAYLLNPTNEGILEILQIAEQEADILYFPQRIINKIGGPIVLWLATIAISLVFYLLNMLNAAIITVVNYIILYMYMRITPLICRIKIRHRLNKD
ncbi:MAG: tetratricopeptide repeat protein, partial [Eubacteriaceae bacterium]|nr:tetratricopeptide repeat protein [Eubacteriaceae bacterium]